jgi:hypothetical protein
MTATCRWPWRFAAVSRPAYGLRRGIRRPAESCLRLLQWPAVPCREVWRWFPCGHCGTAALLFRKAVVNATLADDMPDDDDKPAPIPFTVDVTVDRTRVQVTLLLKPGTAVSVKETKTTTEPEPPEPGDDGTSISGDDLVACCNGTKILSPDLRAI